MLNQFAVHALNRILLLLSISCVTLVQRKPLSTESLVAVLQAELSWFLIQASIGWSHSRSCSRDHPGSEQPSHTWEKNWKITCKLLLLTNHKRYLLLKKSVLKLWRTQGRGPPPPCFWTKAEAPKNTERKGKRELRAPLLIPRSGSLTEKNRYNFDS